MATVKCYDRKRNVTYVYESEGYFDEKKGKYRYKRHLIGKVNPETGETVPTGPHGGYRPKSGSDNKPKEEWVPMKPGRKRKEVPDTGSPSSPGKDKLTEAKEEIQRLQDELSEMKKKYRYVVKKFNDLADEIRRITPGHIDT
ncbi:MAG: hypothetical protein IJ899_07885 [Blautia sp.]|nr:hypothetical protein [Blautia sp.]